MKVRGISGYKWARALLYAVLFFLLPTQAASAGTYDDAVDFWEKYGNNGVQHGNYFYFCTKGATAQGGTKYKTIGYTVSVKIGGSSLTAAQLKLSSGYDYNSKNLDGNTYVLRRIPVTKVQNRLQLANDDMVLYKLYTEKQTYVFDSIMTVTENGAAKGSVEELSNGKVSSSGEAYTTLSGIKGARNWANASDLNNYYDKKIVVEPVNPLSVNQISVSGNNVYHAGVVDGDTTYYVKPSTSASLSFTLDSEFVSTNFKPNANLYHVTGYGNNECVDVRTQMGNNQCLYWRDAGAIGVTSASATRSGSSLKSTIKATLGVPNEKKINVYPQGKVFLKYSITANDNRRADSYLACDTDKYDTSKRVVVIGDGVAPSVSAAGTTVTAKDGGSGVRSLTVLNMDGSLYASYQGSSCLVPGGKYMVYAEDNVGNRSVQISVVNEDLVSLSVSDNGGWNPTNVIINGATSRGIFGAIVVWCPGIGQTEDSEGAQYFRVGGQQTQVAFDATKFYANTDGGYQLHAKTVVRDGLDQYVGEDVITFWVTLDFTPPALGWGSSCEGEFKWGKAGEEYGFACISRDYNRNSAHGTAFASGVRSLTISNADTGQELDYGGYDGATDHFVSSVTAKDDVYLQIRAFDEAGNTSVGYTRLSFDKTPPEVTNHILKEWGVLNGETGWRNGNVTINTLCKEEETGLYKTAWRIEAYGGGLHESQNDLTSPEGKANWKIWYPSFAKQAASNRSASYTVASEGRFRFNYDAWDGCENRGWAEMEVKIDKTPPQVGFTGNEIWNPDKLSVTVSDEKEAVNEVSGVRSTKCYYNADKNKILVADKGQAKSFSLKPMEDYFEQLGKAYRKDGQHSFAVETLDYAGNGISKPLAVYLDAAKPKYEVLTEGGKGDGKWNPSRLVFRLQDDASGLRYYKIEEERGGTVITRAEKGTMGTQGVSDAVGNTSMGKILEVDIEMDGYEGGVFYVREVDEAGNSYSGTYRPLWDVSKPECSIERFGETNGWNPQYVTLTYQDQGSGLSKLKAVEGKDEGLLLANKEFAPKDGIVNSHVETFNTGHYDENLSSLDWFATDQVGNENGGSFPIKIDKTPPRGDVSYNTQTQELVIDRIVEERSGVEKAWVEVYQEGDPSRRQYIPLKEGNSTSWGDVLEVEEDFIREKSFMDVKIKDKAGNEALLANLEVDVFAISASIHRSLSPEVDGSSFRAGEQGYLDVRTFGYMDKVEILFSPMLSQYDSDLEGISYELNPRLNDGFKHYFYVPLYVPEGEYSVQVVGYKWGRSKSVPLGLTVRGSILNDIRTRIRS